MLRQYQRNYEQPIMSSVALKKGVEEPWTIERVASFTESPFERPHGKKPSQEFVPFGEKVFEPMQWINPSYTFEIWLGMRNNSA